MKNISKLKGHLEFHAKDLTCEPRSYLAFRLTLVRERENPPLASSVSKHLLTNIAISMLSLGALAYVTECPDVLFSKAALIVENDNLVVFE